ncbi:recombinase family protein [Thioalkalivibrio sp. ALgr3]|uniref:recombinase family protein n=1 Tax=Thioalkalivibrio sp. ALgr3 TaxID=1239292 RepID=UPI00036C83AA|nr:recombinase family protein [Thioalkalivibrio sp. ALgr3]
MSFIRAYLRASTDDQDASRAKESLRQFASERGQRIAAYYVENESGASLKRPELFRLLEDCGEGDILLVEQVDRLSRLNADDWERLKAEIRSRGVKVVALDLPTSWSMADNQGDEVTERMLRAMNDMMLDMLAALARKDYQDRRRRQAQGIESAKAKGKYRGRPKDTKRHERIIRLLERGLSWSEVAEETGASRSTISRAVKEHRQGAR